MKIITSAPELQQQLGNFQKERIALVATMGCLHEGHISLIRKAKRLADIVVVSIYVNPLQFGVGEDFEQYPKPFSQDAEICKQEGVDFLFHPHNLYPEHGMQVSLTVGALSQHLCGQSRAGHFDGVATVVNILFNIVQPHIAIFGEKDFQQLTIIRRMVADLHMPIEIVASETKREKDGLAKSSRNRYLSTNERQQAVALIATMRLIQDAAIEGLDLQSTLNLGLAHLQQQNIHLDYLTLCHEHTLLPATSLETNEPLRIFIAAYIGSTRLIDNMPIDLDASPKEKLCV